MSKIDGPMMQKMMIAGSEKLTSMKSEVDALNVFPVPDGDTGTNMSMTVAAAAAEANKVTTNFVGDVVKAAANGALRGARGNSGVIMSQLFRGFAKGLEGLATADVDHLAEAMRIAVEMAYKAVMKPKEGTILTVARAIAEKAAETALFTHSVDELMKASIDAGMDMLAKTTDMLPQLKQANVVDAGGQGLLCVLQGAYEALTDKELHLDFKQAGEIDFSSLGYADSASIEFGYCTEFFIHAENFSQEAEWLVFLDGIGDSIVLVSDEEIIKVHVHTNCPGKILEKAIEIGHLSQIKIDNMRMEHDDHISFLAANAPEQAVNKISRPAKKDVGFVAVSMGVGFVDLLKSLDVDVIIEGGQTMNPSTDDILKAIYQANAHTVYVFPNNSNIILAANQATFLVEDVTVYVVPTRSVCQGITALCEYNESNSPEVNADNMLEAAKAVKTGQVTYAVRSTELGDKIIHEGDILGIADDELAVVSKDVADATLDLLHSMVNEDSSMLSIYYGSDITDAQAADVEKRVAADFPKVELEMQMGGQPIYYYLIAVE